MNNELAIKIKEIEKNVEKYVMTGFTPMNGRKCLRFIDELFMNDPRAEIPNFK